MFVFSDYITVSISKEAKFMKAFVGSNPNFYSLEPWPQWRPFKAVTHKSFNVNPCFSSSG